MSLGEKRHDGIGRRDVVGNCPGPAVGTTVSKEYVQMAGVVDMTWKLNALRK